MDLPLHLLPCADACVAAQSFEAEVYALTKDEGGRSTPFTTKYRPQFFVRTADVPGAARATPCRVDRCVHLFRKTGRGMGGGMVASSATNVLHTLFSGVP